MVYMFSFGGVQKIAKFFSPSQLLIALGIAISLILLRCVFWLVRSIKWWKKSKEMRKAIKITDIVHLTTSDNGMDVEVVELLENDMIVIKTVVSKDRLYTI